MDKEQIDPAAFIEAVTQTENIVEMLSDGQADEIAQDVLDNFDIDKASMTDWLDRMRKAIDLAMLVKDDKEYPFKGAANIKYPLVTSAALQFNARAYPAICPSDGVVKAKIWGSDPQGVKAARGQRVSSYMSYDLNVNIEEWEAETDKLTVQLPIVGDMFRKVWWDGSRKRCKLVAPGKFIFNNNAPSLASAPRASEELCYYPHEIQTRFRNGYFAEFEYDDGDEDKQAPQDFIEQHCRIDLDEDGYEEPYIATVHVDSRKLVRLTADFEPDDVDYETEQQPVEVMAQGPYGPMPMMQMADVPVGIKEIRASSYFVHYQFMPGMDGGVLGTGLGLLLGDISETVNTSLNMMIDASHYASLGGGFIGSEFRIQGGAQRMRPGEFRKVEARGADVRSAIVPMTFPGADAVMFQVMGMLIEAAKEVSSTKDILTGDTGTKNMTATTTLALIEQGMKVFTAAYKRLFRGLKHEFRLFARITARTLSPEEYNAFLDERDQNGQPVMFDPREDFLAADMDIQPVADPNAVTKMQEMARAQVVMELAQAGMVAPGEAVTRILEAAGIDDIDSLLPQPDPMQQQMQAMQMQSAQADLAQKMADIELTLAKVNSERTSAVKDMAETEIEARAQSFDEIVRVLELQRDDLAGELARSRERMAGAPNNGNRAAMPAVSVGAPQGGGGIGLLAGQAAF